MASGVPALIDALAVLRLRNRPADRARAAFGVLLRSEERPAAARPEAAGSFRSRILRRTGSQLAATAGGDGTDERVALPALRSDSPGSTGGRRTGPNPTRARDLLADVFAPKSQPLDAVSSLRACSSSSPQRVPGRARRNRALNVVRDQRLHFQLVKPAFPTSDIPYNDRTNSASSRAETAQRSECCRIAYFSLFHEGSIPFARSS